MFDLDRLQDILPVPIEYLFFRQVFSTRGAVPVMPPNVSIVLVFRVLAGVEPSFGYLLVQELPLFNQIRDRPGGPIDFCSFRYEETSQFPVRPDRSRMDPSAQIIIVVREIVNPGAGWTVIESQPGSDHDWASSALFNNDT